MTKIKYYINKRYTKMGGSKNAKEPNDKKGFLLYISKDQNSKSG